MFNVFDIMKLHGLQKDYVGLRVCALADRRIAKFSGSRKSSKTMFLSFILLNPPRSIAVNHINQRRLKSF